MGVRNSRCFSFFLTIRVPWTTNFKPVGYKGKPIFSQAENFYLLTHWQGYHNCSDEHRILKFGAKLKVPPIYISENGGEQGCFPKYLFSSTLLGCWHVSQDSLGSRKFCNWIFSTFLQRVVKFGTHISLGTLINQDTGMISIYIVGMDGILKSSLICSHYLFKIIKKIKKTNNLGDPSSIELLTRNNKSAFSYTIPVFRILTLSVVICYYLFI